jgi:flagellar basal body-associated protein fliL
MSTPFNPNQQPMSGNGQYPTGQPAKKKTGLIIGIVAAVVVALIAAGVAIWWFTSNDDSSDDAAAQSAPNTSAPAAGTDPSAPGGTNPSQPPVGTNPSQDTAPGGGSNSDLDQQAFAECKKEIDNAYTNASVSDVKLEWTNTSGSMWTWMYKGTLTGTRKKTKQNVNAPFTCDVAYTVSSKSFDAAITVKGEY